MAIPPAIITIVKIANSISIAFIVFFINLKTRTAITTNKIKLYKLFARIFDWTITAFRCFSTELFS
jgi:hypothetical protein